LNPGSVQRSISVDAQRKVLLKPVLFLMDEVFQRVPLKNGCLAIEVFPKTQSLPSEIYPWSATLSRTQKLISLFSASQIRKASLVTLPIKRSSTEGEGEYIRLVIKKLVT
jgi:hypothetical protein